MTALRQRMLEDMKIRNLALNTQDSYLRQVSQFARHFGKSPEVLGPEDIRAYQLHLTQEKSPRDGFRGESVVGLASKPSLLWPTDSLLNAFTNLIPLLAFVQ